MFNKIIVKIFIGLVLLSGCFFYSEVKATDNTKQDIFVFVREGCGFCAREEKFLETNKTILADANVTLLDISEKVGDEKWQKIIKEHKLTAVTPITLVGGEVLVGFNEKTTGSKIISLVKSDKNQDFNYYLKVKKQIAESKIKNDKQKMDLPFFGAVDPKEVSLFSLSAILGFIDGFNPCAMWVLLIFLVALSQIGDKRKMIIVTGIFVLAETIMYFLILNVWYQTWDFVQLDNIVTPIIGLVAIGGGAFFIYEFIKSKKDGLVCNITSLEHQQKTSQKIKDMAMKPMSLVVFFAVIALAFSVNIIEFACSIGIPQAFTKILEINEVQFWGRQWYIFIYTLLYMADDFIVFALAIWGYKKFAQVGAKYSRWATLIGGILLLIIGILMILNPGVLVF